MMKFVKIENFLPSPQRMHTAAHYAAFAAVAATILKILPTLMQFVGADNNVLFMAVWHCYESFSLSVAFSAVLFLALALLWLVLSRMFPKPDRLMRYAALAVSALLLLRVLWLLVTDVLFPSAHALGTAGAAMSISDAVTAVLVNLQEALMLVVSLLLLVRYHGRLRQLGVLLVTRVVFSCVITLAFIALQAFKAGFAMGFVLSAFYFLCTTAISVLVPVFLWRAVKG